jgi:hypothetical protein
MACARSAKLPSQHSCCRSVIMTSDAAAACLKEEDAEAEAAEEEDEEVSASSCRWQSSRAVCQSNQVATAACWECVCCPPCSAARSCQIFTCDGPRLLPGGRGRGGGGGGRG